MRSDDRTGPEGEASGRRVDPLADMKPLRGGAEYYELTEAMRDTAPGCIGVDAFTADRIDADETAMLRSICAACPLSDPCGEFAAASRPSEGFWAGMTPAEIQRVSGTTATLAA